MLSAQKKPLVSIVVALSKKNAAIGNGGKLLVYISDDLKRFKRITSGHAVILGRKTYESIGKALPNRQNYVITRNKDFKAPDVIICSTLEEAIEKASVHEMASQNENKEIFLIGGGEIYKQGLPLTDRLYLTIVETDLEGDVFFPDYSEFKKVIFKEDHFDEKTGLKYSWVDLER
jgi:dihydrofolate reductase